MTSNVNGRLWGVGAKDWAAIQEQTCEPVYRAVFAQVGVSKGMRYLDVGCGAGLACLLASEAGAQVTGIDASEDLLQVARHRLHSGRFPQGEIEALPFADGSFDLVTGFNAFQYAARPAAALGEARRVTVAGGIVVIMTWGTPDGMEAAALLAALKPLLPTPPAGAPGPFALSDETRLRRFAEDAGLTVIRVLDVQSPWVYADLATALRGLRSSGVAQRAVENTSVQAVNDAHTEVLQSFVQPDGSIRVNAWFRCLVAKS